jgi:Glyoxalase/Bleomycin resistance protein/Dioxygenase superfamily
MIRGMHGLFYSSEPEAARAFIRDKLKFAHTDIGEGWLIFDLPEGDLGVHPTDERAPSMAGTHDVSFYCDDIHGTVAELKERGVEFTEDVKDQGFGFVTYFKIPGGVKVLLYEPKYRKQKSSSKPKTGSTKTRAARHKTKSSKSRKRR